MRYAERRYSAVPWLDTLADLRPMCDVAWESTLTTRTFRWSIIAPFGKDTDTTLEVFADIASGDISLIDLNEEAEAKATQRQFEPYMDGPRVVLTRRKHDAHEDDNGADDPDED